MFSAMKRNELKWKLGIPWMTEVEQKALKHHVKSGNISIFRLSTCGAPECENDVPNAKDDETGELAKPYCSKPCHDIVNEKDEP